MKNIATRSISGIVYVALIVGSIMLGSPYFMGLAAIFAILATIEFHNLTGHLYSDQKKLSTDLIIDIAATAAIVLLSSQPDKFFYGIAVLLVAYILIRLVMALYDRSGHALVSAALSVLGVVYIGLPLGFASVINYFAETKELLRYLLLIIFIIIWLNDTGAYCVGCLFGRHRLFERLSPKKSWEGFWGGMFFCIASSVGAFYLCPGTASLAVWIGLGIVVCVFATWGDLFESLLKRTVSVKDSGHIMPGHGGILDRIDSLLFVAPAAFIYALATGLI